MRIFLFMILLLSACASKPPAPPVSPPQEFRGSATYSVPVPAGLEALAKLSMDGVSVAQDAETLTVRFALPLELTGAVNELEFRGPSAKTGAALLTGPNGKIECPNVLDLNLCDVRLKDLTIDPKARTARLKTLSKTKQELKNRELVALAFEGSGEPHGLLSVSQFKP